MTTEALKPCPFCGGEAEIERFGTPRQSTIYSCTDCGCQLETGEEWGHGARWNTRPAPLPPWTREAAELALFIQQFAAMRAADPPAIRQRVAKGALNTVSEKAASLLAILSRPAPTVCPENQGLSADNCAASAPASGRGNPTLANKEVGR